MKAMYRPLSTVIQMFFALLFSVQGEGIVSAQAVAQVDPVPVYQLYDGAIIELDIVSGHRTAIAVMTTPLESFGMNASLASGEERRVWSAEMDPARENLYLVEAIGRDRYQMPETIELVRVNIRTGEREFLLQQNVSSITFSPDGRRAVVVYYQGDLGQSNQSSCILDVQSGFCVPLNFGREGVGASQWVNNFEFVLRVGELNPLRLINADTLSISQILVPEKWYIYRAAVIPASNSLLISAGDRTSPNSPVSFLEHDLGSGVTIQQSYSASPQYYVVAELLISPDGRYLLYGGGGSLATLIDRNDGRIIANWETTISAGWADATHLVVQGSRGGNLLEIVSVDARTGQIQVLAQGQDAGGILLSP
jgi:hypothetical protein